MGNRLKGVGNPPTFLSRGSLHLTKFSATIEFKPTMGRSRWWTAISPSLQRDLPTFLSAGNMRVLAAEVADECAPERAAGLPCRKSQHIRNERHMIGRTR